VCYGVECRASEEEKRALKSGFIQIEIVNKTKVLYLWTFVYKKIEGAKGSNMTVVLAILFFFFFFFLLLHCILVLY